MGLAVVLGSFGFSSCNQKEEGKKTESPLQVGQVQDMEGYRKIYDFESQDEINSIKENGDYWTTSSYRVRCCKNTHRYIQRKQRQTYSACPSY